jgi:hypothetical protein
MEDLMNVSFFVEFPDEELSKLSLIDFPVKLYLAAKSLEEFRELEKNICEILPGTDVAYWPLLKKSYWISPFSSDDELDALYNDLSHNEKDLEVLLDLELPNFWLRLFFYNLPHVLVNALEYRLGIKRPRIRRLFSDSEKLNIRITTTSYPATSRHYMINYITFKLLGFIGVRFNPLAYDNEVIFMCYSSIRKDVLKKTLENIKTSRPEVKRKYSVALGLLDYGMLSKTGFIHKLQRIGLLRGFVLLSSEKLDADLSTVEEYEVNDVTIYCLGGLNHESVEIVRKHALKNVIQSPRISASHKEKY